MGWSVLWDWMLPKKETEYVKPEYQGTYSEIAHHSTLDYKGKTYSDVYEYTPDANGEYGLLDISRVLYVDEWGEVFTLEPLQRIVHPDIKVEMPKWLVWLTVAATVIMLIIWLWFKFGK